METELENSQDTSPDEDGLDVTGLEGEDLDGDGSENGTPDQVETLSKRLRDTQAKLTELAQQNAELRGKVSVLDRQSGEEKVEDPFAEIDAEEAVTNPMLIVDATKKANAILAGDVVNVLKQMRAEMLQAIRANDPEKLALRSVIEELKADPELADLDDEVLLRFAKRQKRTAPKSKEVERPSGVPGGGTRARTQPKADDIRKNPIYVAMYGEYTEEKK